MFLHALLLILPIGTGKLRNNNMALNGLAKDYLGSIALGLYNIYDEARIIDFSTEMRLNICLHKMNIDSSETNRLVEIFINHNYNFHTLVEKLSKQVSLPQDRQYCSKYLQELIEIGIEANPPKKLKGILAVLLFKVGETFFQ